ncbi:autotransporter domain-containing protein [Pseudomonas granadensis]|uniref:autotransporter family protein n=1 Tax=Pseudomonas granadensis TaxID=1421430 RepID=UPI0019D0796C|nr:autotransporter outer membrane beta-barrel domain-containing protein [Pseudomonas granadensis]MBN6772184.1 autotransporter domain-containing protein [Pseudomonas granadensis]MBN6803040.1 autotransporter domain-containing protein [Pseudomonas granadensis]MBN6830035.1 autotransporter domain-containing protein [Pseudomonas granadensis]MBN6837261.1 autotransporter domain-containing protein [Pseudomonas granadensis]MBN6865907.1 autotransporter domain-containing protein [Pseudomonas granadensis]
MRTQHGCKPEHLALAISLALGCVEFANAEQPSEAAEPLATIAAPQATEASAREKAAERLQSFLSDPGTVPIVFETAQKTFKGTAVNDLISLKDGASFTGRLDGGEGDNVLLLDATDGGALKDTRNFNGLVVAKGDWTSNSKGDFKEGVLVQGGTALTNLGSIKGDVYVDNGGSFAGKGTVANLQVGGLLTVNGALGAPRVKGDLRLAPTAELAYEVTPSGSQTIKVDGTAALAGATLNIVAAQGEYPQSSQYTILEAGAVEGEFGSIRNNLAFMTATLQYHKKSVGLTYARNDVALEEVATTDAGRAVAESIVEPVAPSPSALQTSTPTPATAVETNPVPAPPSALAALPAAAAEQGQTVTTQTEQAADQPAAVLTKPANIAVAALLSSDKATAPIALEQLAAGSNANLAKATLSSITPVSASMLLAMQQLNNHPDTTYTSANSPRQASAAADTGRVWIQALGYGDKVDRDVDSTLKHATHGLVLGADWQLDEQWHVGLLGGKSQTRLDARQYDGDLDSWHLGAYAVRQDGPMALRLGATWASHESSSKRRVAFNGFSDRLQGNYNANTQQAFAELGYNFGRHNATLEPFASLGYQRYQRDSYREKGGDAALKVFGQTRDNLSSTFGLRTAHTTRLDNGMHLTPRFSAGWKHTYGEIDNHTHQQLIEGGKRFEVAGAALDRNSLSIDTGLDLGLSANHTVGFGLTAEAGNDSRTHGVMGQWRMAF